jgi:replication factor C small subunit
MPFIASGRDWNMLWIEKYRPSTLNGICGQEEIVRHLTSFGEAKTVPHMLVAGPHGTGKSAAIECLARSLYGDYWKENTTIFNTGDLFSQGKRYLQSDDRFSHLFQKDASLINNFKYIVKWYASIRPLDADFKLMVFEEASALPFEAQQALRRIMEQFSQTCRFIYVTTNQSGIIPAISSRCLPLTFLPISTELILETLQDIMKAEGVSGSLPEDELDLIAQSSRGDLRKAIMYLQISVETHNGIDLSELSQSETASISASIFHALMDGNMKEAQKMGEMLMIDYGLSAREVVEELRGVAKREYNDPKIALALAEIDGVLTHSGNDFIQINALFSHIIREVFS